MHSLGNADSKGVEWTNMFDQLHQAQQADEPEQSQEVKYLPMLALGSLMAGKQHLRRWSDPLVKNCTYHNEEVQVIPEYFLGIAKETAAANSKPKQQLKGVNDQKTVLEHLPNAQAWKLNFKAHEDAVEANYPKNESRETRAFGPREIPGQQEDHNFADASEPE
mmetsp:Transcript_26908/g.52735  ORF Transcript_26908/g.52735 Transcript_26908/m.52735 type:complete len:164 (+) Transcript_26908:1033-1524(+)